MGASVTAWRWPRAAALASVAMFAGLTGHVQADGLLPGVGSLVALFLLCLLGAASLLGAPASAARVVALTVGGQTLVHAALTMSAGHAGDGPVAARPVPVHPTPSPPASGGSFHDHYLDSRPQVDAELVVPASVRHLAADLTQNTSMMAAHLAAAVVVGLWLAIGERALCTLLALAVRALVPRLGLVAPPGSRPAPVPDPGSVPSSPHLPTLARSVVRRGPPARLG
ncbi:hypothetical protein [Nocardioides donggukensis]|uniref:Uncharacterized protein n=1 Tax=Nocardioides donggukensis TaxID=2774019 RepID=A0A927Q1C2_9ACTN|nr:hypothetical protein [Nocardioides donggukensis]MBD8869912.1 hypothetical protein [Nocardioides donggukensis]